MRQCQWQSIGFQGRPRELTLTNILTLNENWAASFPDQVLEKCWWPESGHVDLASNDQLCLNALVRGMIKLPYFHCFELLPRYESSKNSELIVMSCSAAVIRRCHNCSECRVCSTAVTHAQTIRKYAEKIYYKAVPCSATETIDFLSDLYFTKDNISAWSCFKSENWHQFSLWVSSAGTGWRSKISLVLILICRTSTALLS